MKLKAAALSAAWIAAALASPAWAHHSFAMFDRDKTQSVVGTVKEFELTNPHSWLSLMVADGQGKVHEWSLEGGAPNQLARGGWSAATVKPGDKVTVSIHPLKDGSNGGQLLSVVLANGQTLQAGQGPGGPGGPL